MAGILSETIRAAREAKPEPVADPPTPAATNQPQQGRGGKRSDPAYKRFGFLLQINTERKARRKSEDEGEDDLSNTVQKLLEQYVANPQ